jgi:hypothetical protein
MRKIRDIGDLHREQRQVEQRKLQLEKALQSDMHSLREYVGGKTDSFRSTGPKQFALKWLSKGLSSGAGLLLEKFGGKIGKIYSWFK